MNKFETEKAYFDVKITGMNDENEVSRRSTMMAKVPKNLIAKAADLK